MSDFPELRIGDEAYLYIEDKEMKPHWFFWKKEVDLSHILNFSIINIDEEKTKIEYKYYYIPVDENLRESFTVALNVIMPASMIGAYNEIEEVWTKTDDSFFIGRMGEKIYEQNIEKINSVLNEMKIGE